MCQESLTEAQPLPRRLGAHGGVIAKQCKAELSPRKTPLTWKGGFQGWVEEARREWKKPGMVVHAFGASSREVEAGAFLWVSGQLGLCNEFQASLDYLVGLCLKLKKKKRGIRKKIYQILSMWTVKVLHTWFCFIPKRIRGKGGKKMKPTKMVTHTVGTEDKTSAPFHIILIYEWYRHFTMIYKNPKVWENKPKNDLSPYQIDKTMTESN